MKAEHYYQSTETMTPREGKSYSTTYYKQTLEQRKRLETFFRKSIAEIVATAQEHPEMMDWLRTPDKRFKRDKNTPATQKHKTPGELLGDILGECEGTKRNGLPKDFAQAPIERWNRLLKGTAYEIEMVQQFGTKPTTYQSFNNLFKMETA